MNINVHSKHMSYAIPSLRACCADMSFFLIGDWLGLPAIIILYFSISGSVLLCNLHLNQALKTRLLMLCMSGG